MAINQVQFQKGLSMTEFIRQYGTEAQCEAALIASRWPSGFICPDCAVADHSWFEREGRQYWQCSVCRHQFSVTSGTVFDSTRLGADPVVLGHAPVDAVQEQRGRTRKSWPRESERSDKWRLCFVTAPAERAQQESRA